MNQQETQTAFNRVDQLIEWRRYAEALQELRHILQSEPEHPDAFARISQVYLLQDDYENALQWVNTALERDPDNQLAWFVRVSVFYETDQEEAFDEAVHNAMRIDPFEPHYYFMIANRLNTRRKFRDAREMLRQGLELSPENPLYLAAASYTEALMGNDSESRQLEQMALPHSIESPYALMYLSWSARERGDYRQQEMYMRNAVRLNPENKQLRDEYLEALQYSSRLYRIFLWPISKLRRLKRWQTFLVLLIAWIFFKQFVILFILLYVLAHWLTRGIIHVRVFGWRRS